MLFGIPLSSLLLLSITGMIKIFFYPLFYFVLFMVYWQCRNLAQQQKSILGYENLPVKKSVVEMTLLGLLGGVFASMLVLVTGLSINDIGIEYIWPLALALLLVNIRFLCFAYAGGIIALANILFGWPVVSAPHVLALVAMLHVTESLLVLIGGRYSALPVYVNFKNKVVGGFLLSNFWPLPLILLVVVALPGANIPVTLNMPEWWPLFPVKQAEAGYNNVLMPITIAAVLGYSSISLTTTPKAKRRFSAFVLFGYSSILFALSYLSIESRFYGVFAALFSFLGHEAAVYLDQRLEQKGSPLYQHCPENFVVLDTLYYSPARFAGVKTNDIIIRINGCHVFSQSDLDMITDYLPEKFDLEVLRECKNIVLHVALSEKPDRNLGIISMPLPGETNLLSFDANHSILSRWYKKYKSFKSV